MGDVKRVMIVVEKLEWALSLSALDTGTGSIPALPVLKRREDGSKVAERGCCALLQPHKEKLSSWKILLT